MKTRFKYAWWLVLVVFIVLNATTVTKADDKLSAGASCDPVAYEGEKQYINITINNPVAGETFTYQWYYYAMGDWNKWRDSDWLGGCNSAQMWFDTFEGDAGVNWSEEGWGWLELKCEIKSSLGRTCSVSDIYMPQPKAKTPVSLIIFSGLDSPVVGKKFDTTAEAYNKELYNVESIVWYHGKDDSGNNMVASGEIATSGDYYCRLYFTMATPYKLDANASAGVHNSQDRLKYDETRKMWYVLTYHNAVEAPVITKQPVNARGSVNQGANVSITAEHVKSYKWLVYENGQWVELRATTAKANILFNKAAGSYQVKCELTSPDNIVTYSNIVKVTILETPKATVNSTYYREGETADFTVVNPDASSNVKFYEWLWTNDELSNWLVCEKYEQYFDVDYQTGKLQYKNVTEEMLALHPRFYCILFYEDSLGNLESNEVTIYPLYETYNGIYADKNGILKYYKNGAVATSYTGLVYAFSDWFYVEKGVVSTTYTGLSEINGATWYVRNGKLDKSIKGLNYIDGEWYYINGGKVDTGFSGLSYKNNTWWYIKNGTINKEYTGLVYYNKDWWYVTNGKLDKSYRGITYMNNDYWYIQNGKISRITGIWEQDGNIYYITDGKVDKSVTKLIYHKGKWYYFRMGMVDWNYTSLAYANNEWWYINKGVLDKTYTGLVSYKNQMWYVKNGKLDKTYTS